jgi:HEAT repeat protein
VSAKRCTTIFPLLLALGVQAPGAAETDDPLEVIRRVSAEARTIPKQADALVELAWPAGGAEDPRVAAAARERLMRFGHHGLPALRKALSRVDQLYTADVTAALIAARWQVSAGSPPDFLPGLVDALWYGSSEAQRLAMIELSRFQFSAAVVSIIDAVQTDRRLTLVALRTLAAMGDPRGRFFAEGILRNGDPRHRTEAAKALVFMGDSGMEMLRDAVDADDPTISSAAVEALLPYARPEELTALYEFVDRHGADHPELTEKIKARAVELEQQWQEQLATFDD